MNKEITIDRYEIKKFIEKSVKREHWDDTEIDDEIVERVIMELVEELPSIVDYYEESNKINLKLAFGVKSFSSDDLMFDDMGRYFQIGKKKLTDNENISIHYIIKKTAPLCVNSRNMFIRINAGSFFDYPELVYGIYSFPFEMTGMDDKILLEEGFAIIEVINGNIVIRIKDEVLIINMTFRPAIDGIKFPDENALICRTWNGILRRVKDNVHGTIILIVKEKWKLQDPLFTSEEGLHSELYIEPKENMSINEWRMFEENVDIFISMLNNDGITIINTDGKILAYNKFVKEDQNIEISGGARTRAYRKIVSEAKSEYAAVYYQSQEGEIKFYNFETCEEKTYFDVKIMNSNSDSKFLVDVKKYMSKAPKNPIIYWDNDYERVDELVNNLKAVHEGIDNFHREKEAAEKLYEELACNTILVDHINKENDFFIRKILNVTFSCFVGNMYGYSWSAEPILKKILLLIPDAVRKEYLKNRWYYDDKLISTLRYQQPRSRMSRYIEMYFKDIDGFENLKNYSCADFEDMLLAIRYTEARLDDDEELF